MYKYSMLLIVFAIYGGAVFAQMSVPARDAMLDAYYALWHQYGRQPTVVEIDQGETYASADYLREWQTWDAVKQALLDRLYRLALLAALQEDADRTHQYYQQCLEIDPNYPQALAVINVDLGKAKLDRSDFTRENAGSLAANNYQNFLISMNRGMEQEAKKYYMLARSQKQVFIESEVERLGSLYTSAVEAYEQEQYLQAILQFEELSQLQPGQIGYVEVYQPHAQEIGQYLAAARKHTQQTARKHVQQERRMALIERAQENMHVTLWGTVMYYALGGTAGMHTNWSSRATVKFSTRSLIGFDFGMAFYLNPDLSAGVMFSQMLTAPQFSITSRGGVKGSQPLSGSIRSLSVFIQPQHRVLPRLNLYGQLGIGRYGINIKQASFVPGYSATGMGAFFGGGTDAWVGFRDPSLIGLRFDVKYHLVRTSADKTTGQTISINRLRFGVGFVAAL